MDNLLWVHLLSVSVGDTVDHALAQLVPLVVAQVVGGAARADAAVLRHAAVQLENSMIPDVHLLACMSICYNFTKGGEVALQYSFRSIW